MIKAENFSHLLDSNYDFKNEENGGFKGVHCNMPAPPTKFYDDSCKDAFTTQIKPKIHPSYWIFWGRIKNFKESKISLDFLLFWVYVLP